MLNAHFIPQAGLSFTVKSRDDAKSKLRVRADAQQVAAPTALTVPCALSVLQARAKELHLNMLPKPLQCSVADADGTVRPRVVDAYLIDMDGFIKHWLTNPLYFNRQQVWPTRLHTVRCLVLRAP